MASKSEDAKEELEEHPVTSYITSGQQEQESNGSGQADDEASTATKIRGRKDQCQVEDCMVDLTKEGKAYCVKRRLCIEHMRADAVKCRGQEGLFRFCFQCGKLEPLSRFEGMKRSCRARLAQRKQREARRCNSDVAYRFSRSQQNLMRQQQLSGQHAHTSSGLAGLMPDLHEELLPLQLHDLDNFDEYGEAGQQQQQQLLPMINPAYTMTPGKNTSFSSSLAPLVEDSACHSMLLPAHCLSDSNNTASAAAVMSGGLHTQGSLSCMRDVHGSSNSMRHENGSFSSNAVAANVDRNCSNFAGHVAQQQHWQQQQQQVLQMQQLMRASLGSGTVQPTLAVGTGAGAMSVPLPSVSEMAAQHAASGSISGPLHVWMGAAAVPRMKSPTGPQLSGLSGPQPGQAAAATTPAVFGCNSAPLPSLLGVPVAPRHGTAAAVAAAAERQAPDFGLDADLLQECLMHLSTDSNVVDEGLPYSDTDLRNLLEGALKSAANAQQQPTLSAQAQQQQQPHVVPVTGSSFLPPGAAGQSACSSQTRTLQGMASLAKPLTVPMRGLSIAGVSQHQQLAAAVSQAASAPLPSITERRMSKAAVLEQLHRIQQEQMALLQQLHMQEAATSWMAPDVTAASAAGAALTLTEDVLQTRLQMVQQQYTQMLLEVQKIKQLNQMELEPGAATLLKFEA